MRKKFKKECGKASAKNGDDDEEDTPQKHKAPRKVAAALTPTTPTTTPALKPRNGYPWKSTALKIHAITGVGEDDAKTIVDYALDLPGSGHPFMLCTNCAVPFDTPVDFENVPDELKRGGSFHPVGPFDRFYWSCSDEKCLEDINHLVEIYCEAKGILFERTLRLLHPEFAEVFSKKRDVVVVRTSGDIENNWHYGECGYDGFVAYYRNDDWRFPMTNGNVTKMIPLSEIFNRNPSLVPFEASLRSALRPKIPSKLVS